MEAMVETVIGPLCTAFWRRSLFRGPPDGSGDLNPYKVMTLLLSEFGVFVANRQDRIEETIQLLAKMREFILNQSTCFHTVIEHERVNHNYHTVLKESLQHSNFSSRTSSLLRLQRPRTDTQAT
jgi:hypothetical protein